MSYSEKLLDPRWQKRRLDILNRDQFKCALCKDEKTTLHIHHRLYKNGRNPWEYEDEELISLCKHCHAVAEDIKRKCNGEPIVVRKQFSEAIERFTLTAIVEFGPLRQAFLYTYNEEIKTAELYLSISEDEIEQLSSLIQYSKKNG